MARAPYGYRPGSIDKGPGGLSKPGVNGGPSGDPFGGLLDKPYPNREPYFQPYDGPPGGPGDPRNNRTVFGPSDPRRSPHYNQQQRNLNKLLGVGTPKRVPDFRPGLPGGGRPTPKIPLKIPLKFFGRRFIPILNGLDIAGTFLPLFFPPKPGSYDMPGAGFTMVCDTGEGPLYHVKRLSVQSLVYCDLTALDVPNSRYGDPITMPGTNLRQINFGRWAVSPTGPSSRMRRDQVWRRYNPPYNAPAPLWRNPVFFPWDVPVVPWGLDPNATPPGAWLQPGPATPYPLIPYVRPNPNRSPSEQTRRGPDRASHKRPWRRGVPNPWQVSRTQRNPKDTPQPWPAPPHRNEPPPRGTKERKFVIRAGWLGKLFGAVTEASDWIDAMYDALPCKVKGGRPIMVASGGGAISLPGFGWHEGKAISVKGKGAKVEVCAFVPARGFAAKAALVYEHFNEMDMAQAAINLLLMHASDELIGRLGSLSNSALQELFEAGLYNSPVGFQFGPAV